MKLAEIRKLRNCPEWLKNENINFQYPSSHVPLSQIPHKKKKQKIMFKNKEGAKK